MTAEPLTPDDREALREVVESQDRLGHRMTIVPNDTLLRLLATLDAASIDIEALERFGRALNTARSIDVERLARALTEVQGGQFYSWMGRAAAIVAAYEADHDR